MTPVLWSLPFARADSASARDDSSKLCVCLQKGDRQSPHANHPAQNDLPLHRLCFGKEFDTDSRSSCGKTRRLPQASPPHALLVGRLPPHWSDRAPGRPRRDHRVSSQLKIGKLSQRETSINVFKADPKTSSGLMKPWSFFIALFVESRYCWGARHTVSSQQSFCQTRLLAILAITCDKMLCCNGLSKPL